MKQKNVFYDISRLGKWSWLIVFPISLSRISNAQDPKKCVEYLHHLSWKIAYPDIWVSLVYTNSLYNYSPEPAYMRRNKFQPLSSNHVRGFRKLLESPRVDTTDWHKHYYIPRAFNYMAWDQFYLQEIDFFDRLQKLRKIYERDELFQRYMYEDFVYTTWVREWEEIGMSDIQRDFFLEEHLLLHYVLYGKLKVENNFVWSDPNRILFGYPGPMLKHEAYIFQQNFFDVESDNLYKTCHYDVAEHVLYDALDMDIASYAYGSGR